MYAIGGPGFGAWRELAANTIVTEGVLAGAAECFSLLHHWRVLPGRPPVASEHLDIDAAVAQYGGSRAVRIRMQELAGATSSLVLFLEYVPDALLDRLDDPAGSAETLERQLFEVVAFLRDRELLHMDGHFGNIRADADRIYLVDFGLATSPRFALSDAERAFAARNAGHDADYAAMRLVKLARHHRVRGACAARRRARCPHRVGTPVRRRRHPAGHTGGRGGHPGPARPRRGAG